MKSIFVRCSRLATIGVLAAYTVVAGGIYYGIVTYLEQHVDEALNTRASLFSNFVHRERHFLEFEFDSNSMPEYARQDAPEYFEFRLADGELFQRSASLGKDSLGIPFQAGNVGRSFSDIRLPDGRHGRAVVSMFVPRIEIDGELAGPSDEKPLRLVLAQGLENLDAVRGALRLALILGGAALFVLVLVSIRWSLTRGLAPLLQLGKEVDAVTPETLDIEFSTKDNVRELAGIRSRLDELIERLGSALERERRFTSAAAHELRTPLAELKTLGQVSARWPDEHELRERLPHDVVALCARMQHTVESLLDFARASKSSRAGKLGRVALSPVIERLLEAAGPKMAQRKQTLRSSIEPELFIRADPTLTESVVRNLIDNAIAHAAPGSTIVVRAKKEQSSVVVETENGRGELEQRDLPHLFEPFWRKELSRHDEAHSGLGLSLVDAWVRSWGGTIQAELVANDVVRFTLRLPAAQGSGAYQATLT